MRKSKSICAAILNFVGLGRLCLLHSLPMLTVMEEQREPCHKWQTHQSARRGRRLADWRVGSSLPATSLRYLGLLIYISLISSHFKIECKEFIASNGAACMYVVHLYKCEVEAWKDN
jgi:hypothetical protein